MTLGLGGLFFARREPRFYTAAVNSHGVRSYQIDGTFSEQFRLIVFYGSPKGKHEGLGDFDRIQDAEIAAWNHFQNQ